MCSAFGLVVYTIGATKNWGPKNRPSRHQILALAGGGILVVGQVAEKLFFLKMACVAPDCACMCSRHFICGRDVIWHALGASGQRRQKFGLEKCQKMAKIGPDLNLGRAGFWPF